MPVILANWEARDLENQPQGKSSGDCISPIAECSGACHPSYGSKIEESRSRPAWAKSETLSPK
jgi:hypothetical protein